MVSHIRITALVDNETHFEGPILSENGISLLVEVPEINFSVLVDTGITGDTLINNSKVLKKDLSKVKAVFLTHNHYDHTGGLIKLLDVLEEKPIIVAHPDIFSPKYAILPSLNLKILTYTGPPFSAEDVRIHGGKLLLSKSPVPVAQDIITSGEIPRENSFEYVDGFYRVENGSFIKDDLPDDQALIIGMDDGIVVILGCGHSGIVNTLNYVMSLTKSSKIKAVVGGLHLIDAHEERIEATIRELKKMDIEVIAPMHCTGFKAKSRIYSEMKGQYKEVYAGDSFEIRSDQSNV